MPVDETPKLYKRAPASTQKGELIMAADMHIHILEGVTEHQVKRFGSNVLGGPYCDCVSYTEHSEHFYNDCIAIEQTPQVWVGEVSWLKAVVFDEGKRYIPDPVGLVADEFEKGIVTITGKMIFRLERELPGTENTTQYKTAPPSKIVEFLKLHEGKKAFTVSW